MISGARSGWSSLMNKIAVAITKLAFVLNIFQKNNMS